MPIKSRLLHKIVNRTPLKRFFTTNRFFVQVYFEYLYLRHDPYHIEREEEAAKFNKAFALLNGFKAKRSLEVGCGEGKLTHYLAKFSEQVIGFDISRTAISRARKLHECNDKINFYHADLFSCNFHGEKYDFIFCSETLYYLNMLQLNLVVPKIIDLLSPNGKLLLVHIRSLKDDESGLQLKEFGAKTIHELFIQEGRLYRESDILEKLYRITLLIRRI